MPKRSKPSRMSSPWFSGPLRSARRKRRQEEEEEGRGGGGALEGASEGGGAESVGGGSDKVATPAGCVFGHGLKSAGLSTMGKLETMLLRFA